MKRNSLPRLLSFVLAAAAIAAAAAYLTLKFLNWNLEDGYIVYRIVENLLAGHGWVYNVGQSYNPSTSVLNPLILTAITYFTGDVSLAAHLLGGSCLLVIGLGVAGLLSSLLGLACATAVALTTMYVLAWSGTWGLETKLLLAILIVSAVREQSGRVPWLLYGIAVLARPDALLLVVLRVGVYVLERRRIPLVGMLLVALPLAPWIAFSLVTFGEIFPATLSNKVWQGQSGFWGTGLVYLRGLKDFLLANPFYLREGLWFIPGIALVPRWIIILLGFFGLIRLLRDGHVLVWSIVFVGLQQGIYAGFNVPAYHWYFALVDFFGVLGAGLFLSSIALRIASFLVPTGAAAVGSGFGAARLQQTKSATVFPIVSLLLMVGGIVFWLRDWRAHVAWASGNEHYLAAAQIILENQKLPSGSLAAVEVGTLGYYIDREIFDFIGLTSPNPQVLSGEHVDQFFTNSPAVVVLHEPVWNMEQAVATDPRFFALYGAGQLVPAVSTPIRIFVRQRDTAPTVEQALQERGKTLSAVRSLELSADSMKSARNPATQAGSCRLVSVNDRNPEVDTKRSNRIASTERFSSVEVSLSAQTVRAVHLQIFTDDETVFEILLHPMKGTPGRWQAVYPTADLPVGRYGLRLRIDTRSDEGRVQSGSETSGQQFCLLKDSLRRVN